MDVDVVLAVAEEVAFEVESGEVVAVVELPLEQLAVSAAVMSRPAVRTRSVGRT